MQDSSDPAQARTTPECLARAAARDGFACAIEDGSVHLSFAALEAEVLRAARAFLAAGVVRGDRVAIWAPNLWEWIVAALGLQSAGAVLVPLNTRFKAAEAGFVLGRSRARILITVGEFLDVNYAESLAGEGAPDPQR